MRRALLGLVASILLATAGLPGTARAQAVDTAQVAEARERISDGAYGAAASLLRDWLRRHPDEPDVRWLLARTLYWNGEFEAARRQLRRTLRSEPDHAPSRELWSEMRELWAPRLRVVAEVDDDAQPMASQRLRVGGGLPIGARVDVVGWSELRRLDAPATGATAVLEGRAGLRAEVEGLELEALAGAVDRPSAGRVGFVGSAGLGVGLPAGLEIGAEARRWSYEHTTAAVDTALLVETVRVGLSRSDPVGWGGELAGRLDRFPDGNEVTHGWGWVLAPLWSAGRDAVRVGYGFRTVDADATRFVPGSDDGATPGPRPPMGPGRPGSGGASGGVYDPYYTPEGVRVHSALAAVRAGLSPSVLLALDGAVGVEAREDAPTSAGTVGTDSAIVFVDRGFTPWRLRGRLAADLSPGTTLRIQGGYREEAFFRTWSASASLEWRFLGGLREP